MVRILLAAGARDSVNWENLQLSTPFFCAIDHNHLEIVRLLLQYGADEYMDVPDRCFQTPLYCAARNNNLSMVRLLLEYGAARSVNSVFPLRRWTPLMCAVSYGNVAMAEMLLEHGAQDSLFIADYGQKTPMQLALERSDHAMIEVLKKFVA